MKIIDVGPLITPLTAHADIHLRFRPGTSGALALSMAHVIIEEGLYDREFVENYTLGFEEYRAYVRSVSACGGRGDYRRSSGKIVEAARLYATTKPAGLMTSSNATTHHTNGLQNHRAITALVGLTGNYDVEGGNPLVPPAYLYVASPGLATREPEFEQPRPWEEMAPRVGQERIPPGAGSSLKPRPCTSPTRSRAASPTRSGPCLASASTTACGPVLISWRRASRNSTSSWTWISS